MAFGALTALLGPQLQKLNLACCIAFGAFMGSHYSTQISRAMRSVDFDGANVGMLLVVQSDDM